MSAKRKEYAFDVNELVGALDETMQHARGKITLRTTRVPLPKKAALMPPAKIVSLRKTLNVSQSVFARLLNVSPMTAKSWETGRRSPCGAALRLLAIASSNPSVLETVR
jgi:DNA-binding transcriptional regulator YiaG